MLALGLGGRVRDRNRGQQRLGIRVHGVVEELVGLRELHHLAEVHHRDPVTQVVHDAQVMGDEEIREVELVAQVLQQVDDLGLNGDVECGDRLVADDELRIQRERSRDAHPLALAAAHLVGIAIREGGMQPADGQQLGDPLAALAGVRLDAVHLHGLADDVADLHSRVQRAVGILEDDLDLLPYGDQVLLVQAAEVHALEDDVAGGGTLELQYAAPGGGLAAAGLSHEAQGLPLLDGEGDVVHRLDMGDGLLEDDALEDREIHLEVLDLDQGIALLDLREGAGRNGHRSAAHDASLRSSCISRMRQHAATWPFPTSSRGGNSDAQRSIAQRQRGR